MEKLLSFVNALAWLWIITYPGLVGIVMYANYMAGEKTRFSFFPFLLWFASIAWLLA